MTEGIEIPRPPRAGVQALKELGYRVTEWAAYTDDWWVGYDEKQAAICTICQVTGKVLVEACKQVAFKEVIL